LLQTLARDGSRLAVTETLLDMPVHPLDYQVSATHVADWIGAKKRPAAFIVQTNVYSLVSSQENPVYRETLSNADLSVPDGMPLVWLLRLKGARTRNRVYGPDLMLLLCGEAAIRGWRCFLYGGKTGVPEMLRDKLMSRFPSLNIVGTYSPPFRELTDHEDAEICAMINKTKPDILWVGLGAPKQDIWMYEHRTKLDVSVMHGVGAAFDFLTGQVRQAPRWMMNAGLEWLFRLFQEPRRLWKRYTVTNLKFLYYLLMIEVFKRNCHEAPP
jgi:N-acetylglucosaminyldiphosphoundecaprenol N-acetyl-beta-D-mannosaminyltransferase